MGLEPTTLGSMSRNILLPKITLTNNALTQIKHFICKYPKCFVYLRSEMFTTLKMSTLTIIAKVHISLLFQIGGNETILCYLC